MGSSLIGQGILLLARAGGTTVIVAATIVIAVAVAAVVSIRWLISVTGTIGVAAAPARILAALALDGASILVLGALEDALATSCEMLSVEGGDVDHLLKF